MKRFLCIHGHFYQPPRENPWLEEVEIQDSAYPYHDWNRRITAECYSNNTASRILDEEMRITDIVSNYAKISFDMGPTLLQWLQKNSPKTYNAIIEADKLSLKWRSGHGAAMAQAYNHMIMPLASERDKKTQILWGIGDFKHRFGRDPEGMWLPETAVDLATLDLLASLGISYTVLAPHQVHRIRKKGAREWEDVSDAKIDPKVPYICNLPSGRKITLFFYDGPISRAVAFERLLDSGEQFAKRLLEGFSDENGGTQLMHMATDGESYGHHHRFGEMALSYALDHIESNGLARITNYGEFLETNPPTHEAEIYENTSWSCSHGVERWRGDCGCSTGANPKWQQQWRAPLREALDALRDELASGYEQAALKYFKTPWAARDDYIGVILNRSDENLTGFFHKHAQREFDRNQKVSALKLLELQRHAMLMYTSCGWFFDDISGIETVQVLQYAGRAIQLAKEVLGSKLEPGFTASLEAATSNVPEHGNGSQIYEQFVKPYALDLRKVAAHYAISSLFEDYSDETQIYCYGVKRQDYRRVQAGKSELLTGRSLITSEITGESGKLSFSVLHLGNHDFNCGVRRFVGNKAYQEMTAEISEAFESGAFADVVRLLDTHFGTYSYSLKDLFRDEQRMVLETLLKDTMESFEASYRRMYEDNRILMGFLKETGIPIPRGFYTAAEFILNLDLKRQIQAEFNSDSIGNILREVKHWKVSLNKADLEFSLKNSLDERMQKFTENPSDIEALEEMEKTIETALTMPLRHNFWMVQNLYYSMAKTVYPDFAQRVPKDRDASLWVERFKSLGEKLNFNIESVLSEG
jgi:alpha-amylase/alpha-mannosidase (GH57 family)